MTIALMGAHSAVISSENFVVASVFCEGGVLGLFLLQYCAFIVEEVRVTKSFNVVQSCRIPIHQVELSLPFLTVKVGRAFVEKGSTAKKTVLVKEGPIWNSNGASSAVQSWGVVSPIGHR